MLLQGEELTIQGKQSANFIGFIPASFSAQEPPEALKALARAIPEHLPQNGLIYGRPQIEAALENIFEWETSQDEAQMSMYLPGESSLFSGLFYLWRPDGGLTFISLSLFCLREAGTIPVGEI